jgi:hypothetical protein
MDGEGRPLCINRAGKQNFTHPGGNLTQFISLDYHRHDRGRLYKRFPPNIAFYTVMRIEDYGEL